MQQAISSPNIQSYLNEAYLRRSVKRTSFITRFLEWCDLQDKSKFLWFGIAFMGGIGTVLPITLMAIVFCAQNNFTLWVIVCTINVPVLITNLAAQPSKVTLPTLFFALVADAIIIISAVLFFLSK